MSSLSAVRSWRTAFLTLRDENLASPPAATVVRLLHQLILSQSDSLIAAAPLLPPHELTSDFMLLLELARNLFSPQQRIEDSAQTFVKLSQLIHCISQSSSLEMNSTLWTLVLDSLKRILQIFLGKGKTSIGNVAVIKPTKQCLESIRSLFSLFQAASTVSESRQLLNFVLEVVDYFGGDSKHSLYFSDDHAVSIGVCEVLTIAFTMIGEIYSRVGASLPVDIWKSIVEALRKVMDILASKNLLLEDNIVARFYIELLQCLHLILAEPRGHLADHVAGFVAGLRIFFRYGLANKPLVMNQATNHMKGVGSTSQNMPFEVSNQSKSGPYRPPHLRKKGAGNQQRKDEESLIFPRNEFISSESDCSDNDGSVMDNSKLHFAKARLAAIICVQDLCRADPKLFTAQWAMLLPSNDVLQHRRYDTSLMNCLLSDPSLKVRIAAAITIMAMLDGPASISLQVAEYREHSKHGSFTSLSSSLGHILMQLHSGTLYLIKHETSSRLLAALFKILMLLIASTPYSRMPTELLSRVISSIQSTIEDGFSFHNDRNSLLAAAIICLTRALSVSASKCVSNMLLEEISTGCLEGQKSGVLYTLFRYSEQLSTPSISLEAHQALKALSHNYPNVMALCWEQISSVVYGILSSYSDESARLWRGNAEQTVAPIKERVMTAAVKVLDECLRAISGFKGTEDLSNDKSLDSPFTSDYVKTKAISSAPSYSLEGPVSNNDDSEACQLASERWSEATVKHMPLIINHSSAMIRAASVTCFAGMTSSVFFSLPKDKQEFIITSAINAALNDEVPSVRSAACRAIGVIACFPQIYHSTEVLEKFIHAAERNSHDSLVSVRITASWALANICDSLGHCLDALHAGRSSIEPSEFTSLLVGTVLRLARDNDKVKANAVRGLGNLARSIQFTKKLPVHGDPLDSANSKLEYPSTQGSKDHMRERSQSFQTSSGSSDWLGQMVQAFLSCVTTGNVKVQWNTWYAVQMENGCFQAKVIWIFPNYGESYYDVVKSVEHVVESFKSDQISEPSNFKYWIALEKQLTSTMLHLLSLASRSEQGAIQDFLVKKASFLEVWIQGLCSSLGDISNSASVEQKKDVICRTMDSLIEVYESSNHHLIAQRFHKLRSQYLLL